MNTLKILSLLEKITGIVLTVCAEVVIAQSAFMSEASILKNEGEPDWTLPERAKDAYRQGILLHPRKLKQLSRYSTLQFPYHGDGTITVG